VSTSTTKPVAPTLSHNVNLLALLGGNTGWIGFTSATGSACGNHDILTWDFVVPHINVHPGSDPNPLNLTSGGTTPVAIFGSDLIDVSQIDLACLTLASTGVKTVGRASKTLCSIEDIGSFDTNELDNFGATDGFDDLVCHFVTAELTEELNGTSTEVDLHVCGCDDPNSSGGTIADLCDEDDDGYFEFIATDAVKIVKF